MSVIEFWFDFGSPYAYFATIEIEELAYQYGRPLKWNPFSLTAPFEQTGMRSLFGTPLRGDYAKHDWSRISRRTCAPFKIPQARSTAKVGRIFYWLSDNNSELAVPFAKASFHTCFGEGIDPGSPDGLSRTAGALGLEQNVFQAAAGCEQARVRYRQASAEAVARGVFGAPFFFVDGEPFWGVDRLPMIRDWLDRGGW